VGDDREDRRHEEREQGQQTDVRGHLRPSATS
jgi:hypothetical protein